MKSMMRMMEVMQIHLVALTLILIKKDLTIIQGRFHVCQVNQDKIRKLKIIGIKENYHRSKLRSRMKRNKHNIQKEIVNYLITIWNRVMIQEIYLTKKKVRFLRSLTHLINHQTMNLPSHRIKRTELNRKFFKKDDVR